MLDNLSYIANIDKSNMRSILQKFSQQCKRAIEMGRGMNIPSYIRGKKIDKIVVCGLGGSAIGGDILKTLFSNKKILIKVSRDYHTPSWINKQTLVFVISYSGNTEETISSFKEALIKDCTIISVTSGGEIQKLSEKNDVPVIKVPPGMPPRCAVGFLSIPVIVLLEKILNINLFNYHELIETISNLGQRYLPDKKTADNLTKSIARKLKGKIPLIYGVNGLTDVVAHRLKTQFNENSKIFATWDIFPEMNHNEIVPFSGEGKVNLNIFYPLFIRDKKESKRIACRIQITQNLLRKKGIDYSEIWTMGEDFISKIFSSIYSGDWISFYLAVLQEVDPTPVNFINLLKNELKKI